MAIIKPAHVVVGQHVIMESNGMVWRGTAVSQDPLMINIRMHTSDGLKTVPVAIPPNSQAIRAAFHHTT